MDALSDSLYLSELVGAGATGLPRTGMPAENGKPELRVGGPPSSPPATTLAVRAREDLKHRTTPRSSTDSLQEGRIRRCLIWN